MLASLVFICILWDGWHSKLHFLSSSAMETKLTQQDMKKLFWKTISRLTQIQVYNLISELHDSTWNLALAET